MFITRHGFGNGEPFLWSTHTNKKVNYIMASNGIFDEMKIDETLNIIDSIEKENWGIETAFLAKFQNNLEAGNISAGNIKIQKIRFKRRKVGDLSWETMIDFPFSDEIENYDTEDFYIENATNYEYGLVPVIQNFEGVGVSETITTNYSALFLTGRDIYTNELKNYPLRFDLKTSEIVPNFDRTYQKTLSSKYPAILCGESNYLTGNISVKLISPITEDNNGKINIQAEKSYREAFESFIASGHPMLIRNHSLYILGTISEPKKNPAFEEETAFGIYDFTMSFTEYGDGKDMDTLQKNNLTYEISTN